MVWCCPPGDASCWGWGQACQTGKKECNSGTIKWCCDEVYEDCEFEFNKVSLCLLKTALFANPLSASPSTLDSTMSSTRFTATIEVTAIAVVAPSDATASSRSTITRSSGPTSTERPASSEAPTLTSATSAAASASAAASPGISTGAAAGAGVGGVLGFIAIVVGVFCLMRRSRRRRQEEDGGEKVAGGSVGGDPSVGLMSPQGWPPVAISECAGTPVQNRHELETKTWHHELDVNPLELEAMQRPVGAMLPQRNVTEMQRPRW
ncbi:hypothetical protein BZA05DRAFT_403625 [Tricharina praecox]|uniref:uncharacterized protein n=1 Tax=Tricharina praecox TaxID=43433 RepID=UPI00221F6A98|nr:uncharacterized protein BZA05DRAFT_403625 [Tricharina praecox]KAI5848308.1 hypothetical protein BZA05DRAFT_403625 [Tricharina praecox]